MTYRPALVDDESARRLAQTEFDHPVAVEAGAGTGKTTVLVARILAWCLGHGWNPARDELLADGTQNPSDDEIASHVLDGLLAITFTEAAAAQMTRRVAEALVSLAADPAIEVTGFHKDQLPAVDPLGPRTACQGSDRCAGPPRDPHHPFPLLASPRHLSHGHRAVTRSADRCRWPTVGGVGSRDCRDRDQEGLCRPGRSPSSSTRHPRCRPQGRGRGHRQADQRWLSRRRTRRRPSLPEAPLSDQKRPSRHRECGAGIDRPTHIPESGQERPRNSGSRRRDSRMAERDSDRARLRELGATSRPAARDLGGGSPQEARAVVTRRVHPDSDSTRWRRVPAAGPCCRQVGQAVDALPSSRCRRARRGASGPPAADRDNRGGAPSPGSGHL